ncbi:DUF1827 family protein [Aerococcaceae bacterium zg-ZJ1578]|uniref:DUF1827 family protein n=1 Tax=Aerococcaceae TaxID=186827 RepID=UPI0013BB16FB|nr:MULTISPECIES: DUF1827 family protein [unclassified Facklamia]MBK0348099.1 DUF1827 family protein [Aerococcaceae bacterium zg-1578]MBR7926694.1 DUF1827 family protein [Aerococcaceae bacterium zg-ZUI334]MBS4461647.1 DUF1827 family protein [Aerococcaceae bacterium zg-B36]QQD65285.1 DUF1827 family protein [Aerococcaceae bacterium zg-252]NEW63939.1 DUF1827 family protein [Facklamia sp. 252]
MKLIDVTNSHSDLVCRQLENTDTESVRVFSLGKSTVINTKASTHQNLVIINKQRPIREREIDFVIGKLFPNCNVKDLEILHGNNFIEIELR